MEAKAEENYQKLKTKLSQVDQTKLKELLRPYFCQLLEETIDPTKLAYKLFRKDVMSMQEMDACVDESMILYQNLEVYRAVMKKNAGVELIDALYETKNFHILQLLQSEKSTSCSNQYQKIASQSSNSNKLNVPGSNSIVENDSKASREINKVSATSSTLKSKEARISILKAVVEMTAPPSNEWTQTIGRDNLTRINEDTLDGILVRVVTTSDAGNSRENFSYKDFHPQEGVAIIKFMESQLELDLDNKSIGRPPREIYINTRSFNSTQWEWFSKMLYDFCRGSLDQLWLQGVNFYSYQEGMKWMKFISEPTGSFLWFSKLKSFIFEWSYKDNYCPIDEILGLIKHSSYSLPDFWNVSGCQVQIWREDANQCPIVMDPTSGTLIIIDTVQEDLKKEMFTFIDRRVINERYSQPAPVVKLYCAEPHSRFGIGSFNAELMTHLFIVYPNNIKIIEDMIRNLCQFKVLQKVMLVGDPEWTVDLKQLNVLDSLSFIYFKGANCGKVDAETFSWKQSIQTVIFQQCQVTLANTGLDTTRIEEECVMLERNLQQDDEMPPQPFTICTLTDEDLLKYVKHCLLFVFSFTVSINLSVFITDFYKIL